MTQIVDINTENPWWRYDIERAVAKFEQEYGVKPHMIIGANVISAIQASVQWINEKVPAPVEGRVAYYEGIPCEYDPDITCVILKA